MPSLPFAANAVAASRTQAPSSWACLRWAIRWALQGPPPLTTRMNSSQSGWPKSWWPRSSFQTQVGVGQRHAECLGLRHAHVDELLPQLVVGVALDPPRHRLLGVGRVGVGRAEHHQRRPPEPVDRLLHHRALLVGAAHHRGEQLEALALVEGLLLADPDHRAAVGAVRRPAQRHLVADRRSVDQPADGADVGVRQGRVVEDRGVLLPALDEHLGQLAPGGAERLARGVEVEPVPGLVLHLGQQDRLAAQRRRPGDPVALGLHPDDLGVGVLGDLADQRLAVLLRHPVARLDPLVARDGLVELRLQLGVGEGHPVLRTCLLTDRSGISLPHMGDSTPLLESYANGAGSAPPTRAPRSSTPPPARRSPGSPRPGSTSPR